MKNSALRRLLTIAGAISIFSWLGTVRAGDLDPAALAFKLPDQIQWRGNPEVSQNAVLYGDPSKPGLYIQLVKWMPHHNSRPHSHPHDRYIYVLSGTWYVGTGSNYDPDPMTPMPAGSFVTHFGKQIHYDGAKDVEAVLEIVGEGPASETRTGN